MKTAAFFAAAALAAASFTNASAEGPPAGAKPEDKSMSCEQIQAEQAQINADVQKRGEKKAANAKRMGGLMNFAKSAASYAVPGAISQMGGYGGGMTGVLSQSAGWAAQSALQNSASTPHAAPAAKSKASAAEQARLDRLASIAAYRQCAG
jgi:hypothetical protein